MRLLLSVLGVFTVVACIEKPAEAEQNYPWCINKPDTPPQCRYATFEHQTNPRGAKRLRLPQKAPAACRY
jgi:hypothetical protein